DDDSEEDTITLKELQSRILKEKQQFHQAKTVLDSLNWDKNNPPFSDILEFTSASGVPDLFWSLQVLLECLILLKTMLIFHPPFSDILEFTSASGVPDFIKNDANLSPGSIFQHF
ncbi:hypothetical protein QE152_g41640, partial [Popillia japonica]